MRRCQGVRRNRVETWIYAQCRVKSFSKTGMVKSNAGQRAIVVNAGR
jgi:hypothetical protein